MYIKDKVLKILRDSCESVSLETMIEKLRIKLNQRDEFKQQVENLIYEGLIIETDYDHYTLIELTQFRLARVVLKKASYVFVNLLLEKEDVMVSGDKTNSLICGDLIYVAALNNSDKWSFVTVLKEQKTIKANYLIDRNRPSLVPLTDKNSNISFTIQENKVGEIKPGDLVKTNIISRKFDRDKYILNLNVSVEKILVSSKEVGSDISKIIESFDAPIKFAKKVIDEVKLVPSSVKEEEILNRKDYRNEIVVTIDGEDALDFDDAISIKENPNGSFELKVHIADVTHYVKANSPIDEAARERGTSIYVADRVVPMLPTELSNGICSLNPNVDRLTMTVEMVIDTAGNIIHADIFKGVIKSYARLTYTEVNKFIKEGPENSVLDHKIQNLLVLAKKCSDLIRKRRNRQGAMKLETTEIKFSLDEQGNPIRVSERVQQEGEKLIEDFMIAANCAVANIFTEKQIPTLYRIHDVPPSDKIEILKDFLRKIDLLKDFPREVTSSSLSKFVEHIENDKIRQVVSNFVLRSLSKAIYSPENVGHFGLAEENYLHFTSPIRRYPDLIVHRLIDNYILINKRVRYYEVLSIMEDLGFETSDCERRAQKIEYEVNDLETCKFLKNKIGYLYHATIENMNKFGMFVKIDIGLEGFLPFIYMDKDYYYYDPKRFDVLAKNSQKHFNLGDPIDVVVLSVDIVRREVDFCTPEFMSATKQNLSEEELKRLKENDNSIFQENKFFTRLENKDRSNGRNSRNSNKKEERNSSRKEFSKRKSFRNDSRKQNKSFKKGKFSSRKGRR